MLNALKSFLIIEVPINNVNKETGAIFMNEVMMYVKKEIGIYDNDEDQSLKGLVFPSNRINIQLLNSPYDVWERFEDTLSERFNNIEEFISNICNV